MTLFQEKAPAIAAGLQKVFGLDVLDACATRKCGGHVDRALYDIDSSRRYLVDVDYERPPRGLGDFWLKFEETIPESFAPGEAQYRATPSYWCNPLQKHYWPITRENTVLRFQVEKP